MADTFKHLSEADQNLISEASKKAEDELMNDDAQYSNYLRNLDQLVADISDKIKVVDKIHSHSPSEVEEAAIDRWIKSFISLFIKSSRTRKAYDWIRAPLDRASEALEQKTKVTKWSSFYGWYIIETFATVKERRKDLKSESDFWVAELEPVLTTLAFNIENRLPPETARKEAQRQFNELRTSLFQPAANRGRTQWLEVAHLIKTLKHLVDHCQGMDFSGGIPPLLRQETILQIKQVWKCHQLLFTSHGMERHLADHFPRLSPDEKNLLLKASDAAGTELEADVGAYSDRRVALATLVAQLLEKINSHDKNRSHIPTHEETAAVTTWLQHFGNLFQISSRTREAYAWITDPLEAASDALAEGRAVTEKGLAGKWSIKDRFAKNEFDFLKAELTDGFATLGYWIENKQGANYKRVQHHVSELQRSLLPERSTAERIEWLKISHVIRTLKYLAVDCRIFDEAGDVTLPFREETVLKIKQFWKDVSSPTPKV
ncbi:hypothetical protein JCM16303_003755 [Sporobolomyces ruberrimus]